MWSCPGNTWQSTWQIYTPTNLPNHPRGEEELHPGLPHRVPCAFAPGPEKNTITINQLITVFLSRFGAFLRSQNDLFKLHIIESLVHVIKAVSLSFEQVVIALVHYMHIYLRFPTVHYHSLISQNLLYSSPCNSLNPRNI